MKCGKLCAMATKLGLMQVQDENDLNGGQKSKEVKKLNNLWEPIADASLGW